jgi:hypothetical protein
VKRFRVLITGSRHWWCKDFASRVVKSLREKHGKSLLIVHGAARGVDLSFSEACFEWDVEQESHPADWEFLGRAAGPRRNGEMVAAGADLALAFHSNLPASKGTRDCVRQCLAANIPVWLVAAEGVPPERITQA